MHSNRHLIHTILAYIVLTLQEHSCRIPWYMSRILCFNDKPIIDIIKSPITSSIFLFHLMCFVTNCSNLLPKECLPSTPKARFHLSNILLYIVRNNQNASYQSNTGSFVKFLLLDIQLVLQYYYSQFFSGGQVLLTVFDFAVQSNVIR